MQPGRQLNGVFSPRALDLFRSSRPPLSLGGEIAAGLSVGLIALPLALALGIASVPGGAETPLPAPALGIITAIVGGIVISALGGSRVQIGGPTAAFVPIVILIITEHGYSGLMLATMMAGVILIAMGVSKVGVLIKYIPWPVTSGFTTGIAVAIGLTQIPDVAGLRTAEAMPHEFFEKLQWLVQNAGLANRYALGLAIGCIVIILLWPKLNIRVIPGSVVAMLAATLVVSLADWGSLHEVATIGSKFGGDSIPRGLPMPALPVFDWGMVRDLIGPAMAIAILGAIESLLSAVVADGLSGDRHDSNTELIAQGIANLTCPLFGGLPATGAIARTSANIHNGATTPIAGMVHSLSLLVMILVAARWATYIPMAAMAAVLVVVALRMGEWHELRRLPKMPRSDSLVLITTLALTVVFDLVIAVEVGMVLAAALFIKRITETTEVSLVTQEDRFERPEHMVHGKDVPEGVLVFRIFGPFMFGAAEKMESAIARVEEWPKVLILRLRFVPAMDVTGMNALESVIERMRDRGSIVILSGVHQQPFEMLKKAGFIDIVGRENFCDTFDDALERAKLVLEEK